MMYRDPFTRRQVTRSDRRANQKATEKAAANWQPLPQKSHDDELLPMAPEFAEFLTFTPLAGRRGRVSPFTYRRKGRGDAMCVQWVSIVISKIGAKAGVVVNSDSGKTASAHDLRRAFGQRWASSVMPAVLQHLMRLEDISTTLKFYVGSDSEATADVLRAAIEKLGTNPGTKLRQKVKN